MKTRLFAICTLLVAVVTNASAQLPRLITLKPAVAGKVIKHPESTRRSAPPPPLSAGALLAALKSSTKVAGSTTTDYVHLSANQPFVKNKGMLSLIGGMYATGANGGAIFIEPGLGNGLGIFLIPNPTDKTYLVDVLTNVQAGDSVEIQSPDGSRVSTKYAAGGDQHLLLMVTPQTGDTQFMALVGTKTLTFYSCKISVLK